MALTHNNKTNSIFISQKNYIEDMATKFNVQNTKPPKIPIPLGINFSTITNDKQQKDQTKDYPYHELIGSLMFATTISCPDIAYAINKLT